jgi:hypothetical protein
MEGLDDEQFQTPWRGCNSVNDNRDPGYGTASCPRTRFAGFLPKLGRWVPRYPGKECYVVGTRLVRERASETLVGEALRPRAQDVSEASMSGERRPNGPPLLLGPLSTPEIKILHEIGDFENSRPNHLSA